MKKIYINADIWIIHNYLMGNFTIPPNLLKTCMDSYDDKKYHIGYNIYATKLSDPFSLLKCGTEYFIYSDKNNDIVILHNIIYKELIKQKLLCEIDDIKKENYHNSIYIGDKSLRIYTTDKHNLFFK